MFKDLGMMSLGLIAVSVLLGLFAVYWFFFRSTSEGFSSNGKKAMVLFFLPGCGWCSKMMPEWEKLEASQEENSEVDIKKVDCGENPEVAKEQGISGFPTIIMFGANGEKKVFEGDRTKESFEEFITSN